MEELEPPKTSPRKKKASRPAGEWCILVVGEASLFVVGEYRPLAVELLKQVVPGGARRFYRTVGPEFFGRFGFNPSQTEWLQDAKLFNGTWEVLPDYRRSLLDALSLDYPQVWIVEDGQSRPYQLPVEQEQPDAERYALGPTVTMPLSWARSYSLYCQRHRTWETQPCKDAGVIVARESLKKIHPATEEQTPTKKKWPDLELHAARNTLVRASRQQTSFYLTAPTEPERLGRDQEGEKMASRVIAAQRLALTLRAALHISKQ